MKLTTLLSAILVLSAATAHAQNQQTPPPTDDWIQTDRPDNTDSPFVIEPGTYQLESGILFRSDKENHFRQTELLYPRMLVRIGLFRFMELRLAGDHRREEITPLNPKGETVRTQGLNAVTAGTKIRLYEGEGIVPSIATVLNLTLPFFSDYAPLKVAPSARLALGHEITQSLTLEYNIGWERSWEEGEVNSQAIYTAVLANEFSDRFTAFVEVFGEKAPGESAAHFLDAGLMFRIRRNLQLDIWAGKGLTASAQNYFIGSGFGFRLPR